MEDLKTLGDARRYACENGISYVVIDARPVWATNYFPLRPGADGQLAVDEPAPPPVFANRLFRAYAAAPC